MKNLPSFKCVDHTVYKLHQWCPNADWVTTWESVSSHICSKLPFDCLTSSINWSTLNNPMGWYAVKETKPNYQLVMGIFQMSEDVFERPWAQKFHFAKDMIPQFSTKDSTNLTHLCSMCAKTGSSWYCLQLN